MGSFFRLAGQRIRPHLELHDLAFGALPAFNVPDEVGTVIGIESSAFPAGIGIIDTGIHTARVEAQWIGDAEVGPLLGLGIEGDQGVGIRAIGKGYVYAQAYDVMLVDPIVVMEVSWDVRAFQLRTLGLIERPAFRALAAIHLLLAGQVLALADIEAGQVAGCG